MGADSFSYPEEAGIPIGKKITNQCHLYCCVYSSELALYIAKSLISMSL